jgi:hypothetical protein
LTQPESPIQHSVHGMSRAAVDRAGWGRGEHKDKDMHKNLSSPSFLVLIRRCKHKRTTTPVWLWSRHWPCLLLNSVKPEDKRSSHFIARHSSIDKCRWDGSNVY